MPFFPIFAVLVAFLAPASSLVQHRHCRLQGCRGAAPAPSQPTRGRTRCLRFGVSDDGAENLPVGAFGSSANDAVEHAAVVASVPGDPRAHAGQTQSANADSENVPPTIDREADPETESPTATKEAGSHDLDTFFPTPNATDTSVGTRPNAPAMPVSRRELLQGIALFGGGIAVTQYAGKNRAPIETPPVRPPVSMIPTRLNLTRPVNVGPADPPVRNDATNTGMGVENRGNAKISNDTKLRQLPANVTRGRLEPVNFTKVAAESAINVTLVTDEKEIISVDAKNLTKVKTKPVPSWWPAFLTPAPQIVKTIPDSEVMAAAILAGSATEMVRTTVLYPVQTVKTRIQTDINNRTVLPPPIGQRLQKLAFNVRRHVQEGDLYAGIVPSLIVSVPATGVYYGSRDITKRMLSMTSLGDVVVTLAAATVADIISLVCRTPAETLAVRQQNQDEDGNWIRDSLERLPAIIVTDLPYLLTKLTLNRVFIHGGISIDQYIEGAVAAAIIAAFLTTPFDVARTRILVDSDGDTSNGLDGGSMQGVFVTMKQIMKEGDGGVANLFAGWLERVLYLGVGRAWLEPFAILGYAGIRDAVLLKWL